MFGIQYHDVRARIEAYVEGGSKKCVKKFKKVPKNPKSQLFGWVFTATRLCAVVGDSKISFLTQTFSSFFLPFEGYKDQFRSQVFSTSTIKAKYQNIDKIHEAQDKLLQNSCLCYCQ